MTNILTETFSSLEELINGFHGKGIVRIEGGNIIPCDSRAALVLESSMGSRKRPSRGHDSYSLVSKNTMPERYMNRRFHGASKNPVAGTSGTCETSPGRVDDKSKSVEGKFIHDPGLSLLSTILRFRANGYIVQRPLGSHWGPNDLIAWKSPIVEKLRKYRLIGNGCHINELLRIRELGRVESNTLANSSVDDLAFIAAAASASEAMKDDGAMNRLIGISWLRSNPDRNVDGIRDTATANRLYVSFPLSASRSGTKRKSLEDLVAEFEQRQQKRDKVGLIIFEPGRLSLKESSDFPHEERDEQIRKYEMNIKRILLENFRVYELFDFMEKLEVEFCRDFEDQIFWEFDEKVKNLEIDVIISELTALMDNEDELE